MGRMGGGMRYKDVRTEAGIGQRKLLKEIRSQ